MSLGKINSGVDGVAGNLLTATDGSFNSGDGFLGTAGKTIRMANGLRRTVLASPAPTASSCTVDGDAVVVEPLQPFYILGPNDNRVTPTAAELFPDLVAADCVGLKLYWETGEIATIIELDDDGYFRVDTDRTIPAGAISIENAKAYAPYEGESERRHNRMIWSMPGLSRRFAAEIPCIVDPTSNTVKLKYPVRSLQSGMDVTITGAGVGGGNLTATITLAYDNAIVLANAAITDASAEIRAAIALASATEAAALLAKSAAASTLLVAQAALVEAKASAAAAKSASELAPLDNDLLTASATASTAEATASSAVDAALAAVESSSKAWTDAQAATLAAQEAAQPINTSLVAADAQASIAGLFEDLEGDGSGIIRALKLGSWLAIYKTSGSFFLARYTGSSTSPFVFEEIKVPFEACLPEKHKHAIISMSDTAHIYAADSDFYTLDTTSKKPRIFEPFRLCGDIFFNSFSQPPDLEMETIEGTEGGSYRWSNLNPLHTYTLNTGELITGVTSYTVTALDLGWPSDYTIPWLRDYSIAHTGSRFAFNNAASKEIYFCFESQGEDSAICFDYMYGTARTTSAQWTAGGSIRRPSTQTDTTQEIWCVLGNASGGLMRYGLVAAPVVESGSVKATKPANAQTVTATSSIFTRQHIGRTIRFSGGKLFAITGWTSSAVVTVLGSGSVAGESFQIVPAIWHRDGEAYDSVLQSGLDDFGASHHEKLLNGYVVVPSSQSDNSPVAVMFRGGSNPSKAKDLQGATIASPNSKNLLKPTVLQYYIGDRLTVGGINTPFEMQERILTIVPRNSSSFGRRGNGT